MSWSLLCPGVETSKLCDGIDVFASVDSAEYDNGYKDEPHWEIEGVWMLSDRAVASESQYEK